MLGHGGTSRSARPARRALIAIAAGAVLLFPAVTAQAQTPPTDTSTTTSTTPTTTTVADTTTTVPATAPPTDPPPPVTDPRPPVADPPLPPPLPGPQCKIFETVRYNSRGPAALCAEQILAGLGYVFVGPDDWFGISSVNSLKAYQRSQGLPADGIVGPTTGTRLGIWAPPAPPPAPPPLPEGRCTISSQVRYNTRGPDALCAELVLASLGYAVVGPDDWFGISSVNSLKAYQRSQGLHADGIVGPITGARLGILGSAPSAPAAAPAPAPVPQNPGAFGLPANSGSGRRVVYDRGQQRIWAVEADGTVVKTHRVSGRTREPYAGTYHVYSRSMYTYSTENPLVKWRYMVRFAHGPGGGRIGFHEIPTKHGVPLQSNAQLGQPLSGGCVRQSTPDAQWMWNWAGIGTTVVVI